MPSAPTAASRLPPPLIVLPQKVGLVLSALAATVHQNSNLSSTCPRPRRLQFPPQLGDLFLDYPCSLLCSATSLVCPFHSFQRLLAFPFRSFVQSLMFFPPPFLFFASVHLFSLLGQNCMILGAHFLVHAPLWGDQYLIPQAPPISRGVLLNNFK
ncbi:hypothetical protein BKA83DRAFT_4249167 [Pisolithus microcarpus]|nr:hypothetical protein BKA83DRAFT_4249167 [Pisolithus microcarpus]